MNRTLVLAGLLCLGGCSLHPGIAPPGPSVAEATARLPDIHAGPPASPHAPNTREVLNLYEEVVTRVQDRELRYRITQRISALQFEQACGVRALHPVEVLARAYREDGFPQRVASAGAEDGGNERHGADPR